MRLDVVHHGDALQMLVNREWEGTVDLAYVDPPFFTQKQLSGRSRHTGAVHTFDDRWNDLCAYTKWMQTLVEGVSNALKPAGAIFVHCDWRTAHHIRLILDDVFGVDNFRNEIIWSYRKWTNSRSSLQRTHQTVLYYSKSPSHEPTVPRVAYSPTTNLDQIWQSRTRPQNGVAQYLMDHDGAVSGGPKGGVPMGDVWDIPYLNPKAKERVGYPTQKPLALLERIVSLASPVTGLVLDPCCGSGTTLVAAKLLGRHWIGIDSSAKAVALAHERLDKPVRSFSAVETHGRDVFQKVIQPETRGIFDMLQVLEVHRNRLIDGFLSLNGLQLLDLPKDWNVIVRIHRGEPFDQLVGELEQIARKKRCNLVLLLSDSYSDEELVSSDSVAVAPVPKSEKDIHTIISRILQIRPLSPTMLDVEGQTL